MSGKRFRIGLLPVAAAILVAGCARDSAGDRRPEEGAGREEPRQITLTRQAMEGLALGTEEIGMRAMTGSLSVPAALIPDQDLEAQVASLVTGRVRAVFVRVGDAVRKGDVLMEIEGLQIGEIKADFLKAKAQLSYAEAALRRQKSLVDQNVGSQKALIEAQAEYDKALAVFTAEDRKIHSIGLTDEVLERYVAPGGEGNGAHTGDELPVKAPIAGTVVERSVVIGQLVDPSTTAFRIINTSTLWADGRIYERDVPRLSGTPRISLSVTAFPGETFDGRVIFISPVVDERSRTITVRAAIPNARGVLKPQMFGEMVIPLGPGAEGLLVPGEAVMTEGSERYVFVALSDTSFVPRAITLGGAGEGWMEVTSGLAAGERVVTRGAFLLKSELKKESFGEER